MRIIVRSLRLKILVLMVLAGLTFHIAFNADSTEACTECVALTGGLCVGCDESATSGHDSCTPDQTTCSCTVSGTCSTGPGGGPGSEGGGQN